MTRVLAPVLFVLLAACREDRPPVPTAEQAEQLNEAEALLNEQAEAKDTGAR